MVRNVFSWYCSWCYFKENEMTEFEDEVIRLLKEILKKLNENKSI
jgi:hypothetical protein